jgi:hypothetical protein
VPFGEQGREAACEISDSTFSFFFVFLLLECDEILEVFAEFFWLQGRKWCGSLDPNAPLSTS